MAPDRRDPLAQKSQNSQKLLLASGSDFLLGHEVNISASLAIAAGALRGCVQLTRRE